MSAVSRTVRIDVMAERPSGLHYKEKEILGQNTEKKPFESASRK